jgi:CheY-like chemotaxis protein
MKRESDNCNCHSKKTSQTNSIKIKKNPHSQYNPSRNKVESNFELNVQDFTKLDLSKINNLNKNNNRNIFNLKINNFNINANNMTIAQKKGPNDLLVDDEEYINILVVDDEVFTRQSTVRILYNKSKTLKIKINIIEAEDGLECIYLVYKCVTQGVKISMILSDENMNFMYGSRSAEILKEIISKKRIAAIPFYLLTAYDNTLIEKYISPCISQILSKPLTKDEARKLLLKAVEDIS